MQTRVRMAMAVSLFACGCVSQGPTPYAAAFERAAVWLAGLEHDGDWPADPLDATLATGPDLYRGRAGVVLFLLDAAESLGRDDLLQIARRGANRLVAELPEDPRRVAPGLYTGIAGIGYVLGRAFEITGDDSYRFAAKGCVALLQEGARRHDDGVDWNGVNDVISGSAGIGLFLLWTDRALDERPARELAERCGHRLLGKAIGARQGRKWPMSPGYPRLMPNFSHGTAGICYFLACLYERTKQQAFLDAATDGARYLVATGGSAGGCKVFHHEPGGEDLYYLGWCHGPAGTARLFWKLFLVTGDTKWHRWTERAANSIVTSSVPERRTPGFWNNAGVCCGSAGVIDLFVGLYRATGDNAHLAFARRVAGDLIRRATNDENGARWVHAEHRVRPDELRAQTGHMQGAAGIARVLLDLDRAIRGSPALPPLPDSPF